MNTQSICTRLRMDLSDYIDGTLDTRAAARVESHIAQCARCKTLLSGMSNVVRLVKEPGFLQPPDGFSNRLRSRLRQAATSPAPDRSPVEVPIGITEDRVPPGSHLIYFWQTQAEFDSGVRFLHPGLGKDEHCIIFGHDEALEAVQAALRSKGFNPSELIADGKLTVLRRRAASATTLAEISHAVEAAIADGATLVRFLGNLGIGRDPLPAGEDDVLDLERKATALIGQLPCVIVCMYDVRTLPGRLVFKGGLETHRLSVCSEGVHENPFYVGDQHSSGSQLLQ